MREYQSLSHVRLGMQVPYSLCSQVSEESSLWPNPAEDWKKSALSAKPRIQLVSATHRLVKRGKLR